MGLVLLVLGSAGIPFGKAGIPFGSGGMLMGILINGRSTKGSEVYILIFKL